MRKTLTTVLLALTLPALAMAMPDEGPRRGAEHGPRMLEQLDLNESQRQQLRQLMEEQRKSRQAIVQRYLDKLPTAEREAMKAEMQAAKDKQQQAIRGLLEPEQRKAFDAQLEKRQARRAERQAQ